MAITYTINNPIVYPLTTVELTVVGDGSSTTLVVPLAQYPFLVSVTDKNSPTGAVVSSSSPLSSFSLDVSTLELTLVWPSAGAANGPLVIQPAFSSF